MGQVSRKINPSPPNGRPRYNLDDYIRQRGLCEVGDETSKERKKESKIIVIQEQVQTYTLDHSRET